MIFTQQATVYDLVEVLTALREAHPAGWSWLVRIAGEARTREIFTIDFRDLGIDPARHYGMSDAEIIGAAWLREACGGDSLLHLARWI